MSLLNSFPDNLNVAVIGASGGIGSEFVRQLVDDERVARVHALARNPVRHPAGKVTGGRIDICDEDSVNAAAADVTATGKLDLVIVATGILHRGDAIQPEKSLREIDPGAMMAVMRINTIGPAIVAKAFLPHMRRNSKSVFAALSARVGSISDNRLGGWVSYRSSKAALNMMLKTLSIEHARRFPESVIVGLHPGTVDTELSVPFQRRVPAGKLFAPSMSVRHMMSVIDRLTPANSGGVFAWDGSPIEY
jgi:NAD(P)-dependent dehydrogenase (short-subunit alcohol dehydrogenase family)